MRTQITSISTVALLALTACGSGDGVEDLGDGVDSGIQGVPVPEAAEEHGEVDGAYYVPETRYRHLVSWYEERLPIDDTYEGLEYCETQDLDDRIVWLWWEEAPMDHDGTPWLSVTIRDAEPLEVSISYTEDDYGDCY